MPRGVKKENLPCKICVICQRPFNWRKKWENCWDEVSTCSKSCNRHRRADKQKTRLLLTKLSSTTDIVNLKSNDEDEAVSKVGQVMPDVDHSDADCSESRDMKSPYEPVIDDENSGDDSTIRSETFSNEEKALDPRAARKAAKKVAKLERRAKREGRVDHGQKDCDLCQKSVDLLIRCTIDASGDWKMVCGKCWHQVSGGVVDGDTDHPHYRYGGLWKNRARRS